MSAAPDYSLWQYQQRTDVPELDHDRLRRDLLKLRDQYHASGDQPEALIVDALMMTMDCVPLTGEHIEAAEALAEPVADLSETPF